MKMQINITKHIFFILMALVTIAGCRKEKECLIGNGELKMENRDVGSFTRLLANGDFLISFSQVTVASLSIFGDSNILPLISSTIANQQLTVEMIDGACYTSAQPIEITASAPNIRSVALNGKGTIQGHNITLPSFDFSTNGEVNIQSSVIVDDFNVSMNGLGTAHLAGIATNAVYQLSGACTIYANSMPADNCTVNHSGSGNIYVFAMKNLKVIITGSGNVYYKGDPALDITITGNGKVIRQ